MDDPKLKDQILQDVHRRIGHLPNKNASILEVKIGFDHVENDAFFAAVIGLVEAGLLFDRGRGYVALTPDGREKVEALAKPSAVSNFISVGQAINSPIQQGAYSHQVQTTTYKIPSPEALQKFVDDLRGNLHELSLTPQQERTVKAQLATIEAQLMDTPNPEIVRTAGATVRNITEGAIGSLLATAAQPGVWAGIQTILAAL